MADIPLLKSPVALTELAGAGAALDGQVPTADGAGGVAWETPAGGATSAWTQLFTDPLTATTNITAVRGTWALSGGVLRCTGGGVNYEFARHATSVHRSPLYAQVEVRLPTQAATAFGGIVGRWNGTDMDSGHQLFAALAREATSGNILKLRLSRSNAANVDYTLVSSLAMDTWHTVGALITPASMSGYVNGEAESGSFAPGEKAIDRVGLMGFGIAEFRNLTVYGMTLPV